MPTTKQYLHYSGVSSKNEPRLGALFGWEPGTDGWLNRRVGSRGAKLVFCLAPLVMFRSDVSASTRKLSPADAMSSKDENSALLLHCNTVLPFPTELG